MILKIVHWVRTKGPEAIEVGTTRADGRATAEARVLGASGWEFWGAGEAIRTMSMCLVLQREGVLGTGAYESNCLRKVTGDSCHRMS